MIKSIRLKRYERCDQCTVVLPIGSIVYTDDDDTTKFFCTKDCVKRYAANGIMTLKYNIIDLMSHIENEIYQFEQDNPGLIARISIMIIVAVFLFEIIT